MNIYHSYVREQSPLDLLYKLIEIFTSKDWLNKNLRIKYQNKRYWVSCSEDRFFAYQINEHCGLGPGVPGWPVCIIEKDNYYDESGILGPTFTALNAHDWLNIMATQNFEVV